jgi:hypothetical protein
MLSSMSCEREKGFVGNTRVSSSNMASEAKYFVWLLVTITFMPGATARGSVT